MTFQLEEISFEKAWLIIRAMQTDESFDNYLIVVRISCHVERQAVYDGLKRYNYPKPVIKKLKAPLLYCLLPRPNCFCLYDINLKSIYDLAQICSLFLQFEILFVDREREYDLKKFIVPEELMYSGFSKIKHQVKQYFFCQLDTDNPHFESDVSQATDYNFVPPRLSLFFHE